MNTDETVILIAMGYCSNGPTDLTVRRSATGNCTIDWGCNGSGHMPGFGDINRVEADFLRSKTIDDLRREYAMLCGFLDDGEVNTDVRTLWDTMVRALP